MTDVCSDHGTPLLGLGARFKCPACLGRVATTAIENEIAIKELLREHAVAITIASSGIPPRFRNARIDDLAFVSPRAKEIARVMDGYANTFERSRLVRPGFLFLGPPGTGKTHLACAIARTLIANDLRAVYRSLPALTAEIRQTYRQRGPSVREIVDALAVADLLVLDELDLHGNSDADYQALYDLINQRYEAGNRPTIAISNRTHAELARDLDERIVSRLLAATTPIEFNWPSLRKTTR